ncbi:hypothetical protein [Ralstonia pickettii]|uniref:hypothetical protein n=1 Tax=Ralstonia pickettii TaxID=329 RepID=UPI00046A45D3|nr:hypothetical protein [Ralstonia pickettii]
MRIHPVNLLIAIVIGALLTYGITSIDANTMKLVTGVGSFIFLAATLGTAFGVTFENGRSGVNIRVLSTLFFVVAVVLNIVFATMGFSQTSYVIASGILFLVFVLVANAIYSSQQ